MTLLANGPTTRQQRQPAVTLRGFTVCYERGSALYSPKFLKKQALSLQLGRHQDERPSMLFRTFAVHITLAIT